MDALDEIEANNNRNLETVELVAAYMRTNAQRAAQRAAQAKIDTDPHLEARRESDEGEADKLDFSSEFTTGDMGLSSQQDSSQILNWKRQIEEEEDDSRRDDDDEQDDEPEEWRGGGWREPEQEQNQEQQEQQSPEEFEEAQEEPSDPGRYVPSRSFLPRPVIPTGQPSPPVPPRPVAPPPPAAPASTPLALQPARVKAPETEIDELAEAQAFWGDEEPTPPPATPPAPPPQSAPVAIPRRLRPAPEAPLPSAGQLAQLDPNLAQLARNLILNPPQEEGYEECVRLLSRFGAGALRMCSKEKVRVEILDEEAFGSHSALLALGLGQDDIPSDGAYVIERHLVLVDRRSLVAKPRYFHPALYYFAHAFDHAQGGETFSSRKAAAVVACFEASTRAYNGFDFVDELAAADPVRYFARSVAVYLGRDDCSDPLWSHQDLFDFDRPMYDYLQYLFARLDK